MGGVHKQESRVQPSPPASSVEEQLRYDDDDDDVDNDDVDDDDDDGDDIDQRQQRDR